jgi:hypothetical protein
MVDPVTTSQAQGKMVYGGFPSVFRPPGQHWAAVQMSLLQEGAKRAHTGFNDGFTPQSIYDRVVMPKDGHELRSLTMHFSHSEVQTASDQSLGPVTCKPGRRKRIGSSRTHHPTYHDQYVEQNP